MDVIDEEDSERGHLATESIDDFGELYVGPRPYPFREEEEVRVLFLIRADKIVAFGDPTFVDFTPPGSLKEEGYSDE